MTVLEIQEVMKGWGLMLDEPQIQRPTANVVQDIYMVFLEKVTGITPRDLDEPASRALTVINEYQVYSFVTCFRALL